MVDLLRGKGAVMPVQIRPLTPPLTPALIGAYRDVFSDPPWDEYWTETAARTIIMEANRDWLVAHDEALPNIILGFAATMTATPTELSRYLKADLSPLPSGRYGYLADIGVRRECRREGLAGRLWKAAERGLRQQTVAGILLRVHRAAVTYGWFHEQLGYSVIYAYDDGSDRVILAGLT